jgi:hypothetical protein
MFLLFFFFLSESGSSPGKGRAYKTGFVSIKVSFNFKSEQKLLSRRRLFCRAVGLDSNP